jgi:transposase-like protein
MLKHWNGTVLTRKTVSPEQGMERRSMAYSQEIRERAEDLYVMEGMTYARVAQLTGISARQITTWGNEENWREKRREYRRAYGDIKRNLVLLRSRLLASALDSMDPKVICAVARLENAAREKKGEGEFPAGFPADETTPPVSTAKEAVLAMQEVLKRKMNAMFAQPERLTPRTIKEIKTSLELMDGLREHYHLDEEKYQGLSDETVSEIRRKILGCER